MIKIVSTKGEIMTPENFLYWLQGYLELANPKDLSETQVQIIKNHIKLALTKVTPNRESFTTVTVPSLTEIPPGHIHTVPFVRQEPTSPLVVSPLVVGAVTTTSTLLRPGLDGTVTSTSGNPYLY